MGMKKKSSEKKQESPVSTTSKVQDFEGKSAKDEIDAIFGKKKRKAGPQMEGTLAEKSSGSRPPSLSNKKCKDMTIRVEGGRTAGKELKGGKVGKSLSSVEHPVKSRKKTEDGLTIYGEDELKWNSKNAGGTSLCPFDCECCF